MVCLTGCVPLDLIVLGALLIYMLYRHHTKNFGYWRDRGIPYLEPHWFFGSIKDTLLRKESWFEFAARGYRSFRDRGYGGLFLLGEPAIFICDPFLIETVLVGEFSSFHDRLTSPNETLAKSLTNISGDKWRAMRLKLATSFTSQKMKGMYDQVYKCADKMIEEIERTTKKGESSDIDELMINFSIEAISSCAFGVQHQSDSKEGEQLINTLKYISKTSPIRLIKLFIILIYPKIVSLIGLKVFNDKMTDYFVSLTRATIKYREQSRVQRNDFLQLLIALKTEEESEASQGESQDRMFTEDCIASFMYSFLTFGVLPSSGTMAFALYEIAKNPSIQEKSRREIDAAITKHSGCTFEAIKDMKYLDQVIQETLRLHCYTSVLHRQVTDPCNLPGTDVTLARGMYVYIPVSAIHKDPQLYPDPEVFDPERFLGNNYKSSTSFMPFGHGPRICISIRFAVVMMKVSLARILSKYTIHISEKMRFPLTFDKNTFNPKVVGGIWLSFQERNKAFTEYD